MDDKSIILQKISKKEAEIQVLEAKLKDAKVYIQALRDILGLLGGTTEADSEQAVLRPGSAMALAREAIIKAGTPLRIDELLNAIGKTSSREARTSLSSALSAYVRRGEIFTRPTSGVFGLIELRHFTEENLLTGPPPGFGELGSDEVTEK